MSFIGSLRLISAVVAAPHSAVINSMPEDFKKMYIQTDTAVAGSPSSVSWLGQPHPQHY